MKPIFTQKTEDFISEWVPWLLQNGWQCANVSAYDTSVWPGHIRDKLWTPPDGGGQFTLHDAVNLVLKQEFLNRLQMN